MNADLRSERAYFKEEMRRRIDLIAADYGVPASEVAKGSRKGERAAQAR